MDGHQNNLSHPQLASLETLGQSLLYLEEVTVSLLKLTLSLPQGKLRARLVDQVGVFDSIADVMRQALDAMEE